MVIFLPGTRPELIFSNINSPTRRVHVNSDKMRLNKRLQSNRNGNTQRLHRSLVLMGRQVGLRANLYTKFPAFRHTHQNRRSNLRPRNGRLQLNISPTRWFHNFSPTHLHHFFKVRLRFAIGTTGMGIVRLILSRVTQRFDLMSRNHSFLRRAVGPRLLTRPTVHHLHNNFTQTQVTTT